MRTVRIPDRDEVTAAARRLEPHLAATPIVRAPRLGDDVVLKLETEQPTGSFKVRGALSALSRLDRSTPVVAASAGNHALGIAYAAARLDMPATVVCATTASPAKLDSLARFPVEVVLHGETYDDAEAHALRLAAQGRHYVSAYNEPDVIAGGGTLALEALAAVEEPVTIVCPIGGGGLIAGVALWASGRPGARVIGVESDASPTMRAALDAGRIVPVEERPTIADGLAGNLEAGSVTVELVRRHVSDVALVTEPEIEDAIRFLRSEHGLVVEGAGAVAAAAIATGRIDPGARTTIALVTGGNIAPELLARVLAAA